LHLDSDGKPLPPELEPLAGLDPREAAVAIAEVAKRLRHHKAAFYTPYAKQLALHEMGLRKPERLFLGGNQLGKTISGGYETQCHLTGDYPGWWPGMRFDHPILCWVGGVSGKKVRDNAQEKLFGRKGRWGTGFIPYDLIDFDTLAMAKGATGLIDSVEIRRRAGGKSRVTFLSYDQDVDDWASDSVHWGWMDEEPPEKHYNEFLARLTATNGACLITMTPMKGGSQVIRLFHPRPSTPERGFVKLGVYEVGHLTKEQADKALRKYPLHERKARGFGEPILGSGMVFTVPEEAIMIEPFKIPIHWPFIVGLDLGGGNHPTAFATIAIDRDSKIKYVTDVYRVVDPRISTHAAALKVRRPWAPVAWPHDAMVGDRVDGTPFRDLYAKLGVKMLNIHAQFPDGSNSVSAGIAMMEDDLAQGQLRVMANCIEWFEEYRGYHRQDGIIVKEFDDLIDATRYGCMMQAYAKRPPQRTGFPATVGMSYDPMQQGGLNHGRS
jgi:phage terminase large subunit-like protein